MGVCVDALDDLFACSYIYTLSTTWNVSICRFMKHIHTDRSWFLVLEVKMCWMKSRNTPSDTVSGYKTSPWKCREYIQYRAFSQREENAQIQMNVRAILTGCICFCLRAISASCAHTIPRRQTSGWNAEKLKAHTVSHYRLLFLALTLHDAANGFSLYFPYNRSLGCQLFLCGFPLIHPFCLWQILWFIFMAVVLIATSWEKCKKKRNRSATWGTRSWPMLQ